MRRLIAIIVVLLALPAYAQLPDEVLNKDYQACMGGENDPQRAAYCNCVRDGMRDWDLNSYGQLAMEQAKAGSGAPAPAVLADLAKGCIAKVLH